ncbi:gag-pol polyprotein [Cucumis melo var. makuwa]|uniref:Gag-pol polyprotein n=1 Tax=Cucumis melo var. makuwa TaxID=1194695 RepID=A0A5D3D6H9_CUCMM|nr:gag-pol polyprotein [Cucumis melo var. makuwa]TYK19120.1 gag-pol polyprotein [Cucumis melo var. makuwa]
MNAKLDEWCLEIKGKGLSENLISISQLCDQGYQVSFSKDRCNMMDSQNKVFLNGIRLSDNCYHWDAEVNLCNLSKVEEASLWHKRLGHISGTTISKVTKADAIIGLPTLTFTTLESCLECPTRKQVKSSCRSVSLPLTSHTLELLHIDLIRANASRKPGRKKYFTEFCENEGIFHEFSAPLTPNKMELLKEGTECYRKLLEVILRPGTTTASYELWTGRKPNRAYRVYNHRTKIVMESINVIIDDLGKTPKRSLDEEDGDLWDSFSHKTKNTESEPASLTEEKDYSPSHSDTNRMAILT